MSRRTRGRSRKTIEFIRACRIHIHRIALTSGDISNPNLPGFPVASKKKDPRYPWFVENFGHRAWELDAMPASELRRRVEDEIVSRLDMDAWNHAVEIEVAEVESMQKFHREWKACVGR